MPEPEWTAPVPFRAIDPRLFLDPLGYLRTELYRQRVVCNTLETMASTESNGDVRADAERVLRYLVDDLPTLVADEEECLFPLLERRALPDDDLDGILARLRNERARDASQVVRLSDTLRSVAEGTAPSSDLKPDAFAFAETRRRHLIWEGDVVLPLARTRLTADDLVTLGNAMARRRGIPYPS